LLTLPTGIAPAIRLDIHTFSDQFGLIWNVSIRDLSNMAQRKRGRPSRSANNGSLEDQWDGSDFGGTVDEPQQPGGGKKCKRMSDEARERHRYEIF
jgi:hypothetical protein